MPKNVHLVVGGNGFLGRVLVQKLLKLNKKVRVIDKNNENINPKVEFLHKNILNLSGSDLDFFRDVEIVYHLAAHQYHSELPRFNQYKVFYENNVKGTENIIKICKKNNVKKFIYVSTDMVYGLPRTIPIKENHQTTPIGDYGKTKLIAENIVRKSGLNHIILRPRLIIGPGRFGVFKVLFNWIKYNKPVFLIGNGGNKYQMISVFDCADACLLCANSKIKNKTYNIGSDNPPTVYDEIKEVIGFAGSSSKIYKLNSKLVILSLNILELFHISPLKKEQYMISNKEYVLDTSNIKREVKWQPKLTDNKMLIEAYAYFKSKQ